jgi:hypothetical protein
MRRQPARAIFGLLQFWTIKAWRTNVTGNTDWSTEDPTLKDGKAPHETRAAMRMHRAGWPPAKIAETLKIRPVALMKSLNLCLEEENAAHREHRPVYDSLVRKGTV